MVKEEPGKALSYLDATRVLNRVQALALAGAIAPDTIKETKLGQAVTMYMIPIAAPQAPEKVQKALREIWAKWTPSST